MITLKIENSLTLKWTPSKQTAYSGEDADIQTELVLTVGDYFVIGVVAYITYKNIKTEKRQYTIRLGDPEKNKEFPRKELIVCGGDLRTAQHVATEWVLDQYKFVRKND